MSPLKLATRFHKTCNALATQEQLTDGPEGSGRVEGPGGSQRGGPGGRLITDGLSLGVGSQKLSLYKVLLKISLRGNS